MPPQDLNLFRRTIAREDKIQKGDGIKRNGNIINDKVMDIEKVCGKIIVQHICSP